MSKSIFHDQDKFLEAGDVSKYTLADEELATELVWEEHGEFIVEDFFFNTEYNREPNNKIKEALDLIYVTAQYLNVTIGADKAKECWDALQANNMSKCVDGKLVKREDGKVLKPADYVKLDLGEILD